MTRLTTGQLRALIRKVCVQSDPDDAAIRYREAVDNRRIEVDPTVDGTAHLYGLDLPPDRVQAAIRRINDLARGLKTSDETRTIDQIRADVFLDLLNGKHLSRGSRGGVVDLHVDLATLARLADDPGELAGYGPVINHGPNIAGAGPTAGSPTAATTGPAASATPTPPAATQPER